MRSNLLLACVLAVVHTMGWAQDVLTLDDMPTWQPAWRFAEGDDPAWSKPDFDDHAWQTQDGSIFNPGLVDSTGWKGVGWFRADFSVDSSFTGVPIAYAISIGGAAEIYLDGVLIDEAGSPASHPNGERPVRFTGVHPRDGLINSLAPGRHHLAVRVSNFYLSRQGETNFGFRMQLGDARHVTRRLAREARIHASKTFFLTGIAGVLALIYALLFAFQPKQTKSLLFAVLAGLAAFAIFADLHSQVVSDAGTYVSWRRYMGIAGTIGWVVGVRLVRVSFFKEAWKLFNVLVVLACFVGLYVYFDPVGGFWSLTVLGVLATAELIRRIGLAVFLSRPGAGIVAAGLLILIVGGLHDYLVHHGWIAPAFGITGLFHFGLAALLAAMALFLGADFARANRNLELRVLQISQEAQKALQEEKVNQGLRIERIQVELDNRRKEFEQAKSREVDAIRRSLTVVEERLKEMKDRLIQVEATASLGRLAAGIAHRVDNQLKGIGNLTALSQDLAAELEQTQSNAKGHSAGADLLRQLRKNLERIREEGDLAGSVIGDILDHATGTPMEAQPVNVNQLLDRYLNLTLHAAEGEFPKLDWVVERVFDDRAGSVEVPPASLGRALMGIFRNAMEALAKHAQTAGEDFQPTITVSTQRLENAVLIRVRDNGPGVPQELRDRIFEPFVTTAPDKAGLGLSIAQQTIVDELDGTFGLEHFKEEGAGFYITIPLNEKNRDRGEETPPSE